jgi:hypothetical protein
MEERFFFGIAQRKSVAKRKASCLGLAQKPRQKKTKV